MKLIPFKPLRDKWMKDPKFKQAYDDLELEFQLLSAIVRARADKGITQQELARRAGTKQSAIARFESGRYNPSLAFVNKLSRALDLKLKVTSRR